MPAGAFQSFAQTGDQLGDQQRVAASPEEVLLDAQRRVVQHLPPECQQRILQFVGRCLRDAMPKVRLGLAGKAGQGLAVDLAVAGDRQAFEHAQLRREHVARHPRFDEGQQLGRLQAGAVGLAASQQDIVAKQVESAARRHHPQARSPPCAASHSSHCPVWTNSWRRSSRRSRGFSIIRLWLTLISLCSRVSSWITSQASALSSSRRPASSAGVSSALFKAPELSRISTECGATPGREDRRSCRSGRSVPTAGRRSARGRRRGSWKRR